jgi:hypothetical protein
MEMYHGNRKMVKLNFYNLNSKERKKKHLINDISKYTFSYIGLHKFLKWLVLPIQYTCNFLESVVLRELTSPEILIPLSFLCYLCYDGI